MHDLSCSAAPSARLKGVHLRWLHVLLLLALLLAVPPALAATAVHAAPAGGVVELDMSVTLESAPAYFDQAEYFTYGVTNTTGLVLNNVAFEARSSSLHTIDSITTGVFSGFTAYAPGIGVRVRYTTTAMPDYWVTWGASPAVTQSVTLLNPLPANSSAQIAKIRWELGSALVAARTTERPEVRWHVPSGSYAEGTSVGLNLYRYITVPGNPNPGSQSIGYSTNITTVVANPQVALTVGVEPSPEIALGQPLTYLLRPDNTGNVALDALTIVDPLPSAFALTSVSTGAYSRTESYAAGVGVQVEYEKNTAPGIWTFWGSAPDVATDVTLTGPPPGLAAGEYVTRLRWLYGRVAPEFAVQSPPSVSGSLISPDHAGQPVNLGATISSCPTLSAIYTASAQTVTASACAAVQVVPHYVRLDPQLTSSAAFSVTGRQTVTWNLALPNTLASSDPLPLADVVVVDWLPASLADAVTWSFDDQDTTLPAPQVFEQLPNFANSGRTLLRWRWEPNSGSLPAGAALAINLNTQPVAGAAGAVTNTLALLLDSSALDLRCAGQVKIDTYDFDGDQIQSEPYCDAAAAVSVVVPDLTLMASAPASAAPGAVISATFDYANIGTHKATGAYLVALVPEHTTALTDASTPGWLCLDGGLTPPVCRLDLAELAPGASGSATLAVQVDDPVVPAVAELTFAALIGDDGSSGADPSSANNISSASTALVLPDVAVAQAVAPASALPGQPVTFTLALSAAGTTPATHVRVTDTLPLDLSLVDVTSSVPISLVATQPYVWSVADLPPGSAAAITITAIVSPALSADAQLINTAQISAAADSIPANSVSAATVTVTVPRVDLTQPLVSVAEDAGTLVISATLDQVNPFQPTEVDFTLVPGTASAGSDYVPLSATLIFAPGVLSASVTLTIVDDIAVEQPESLVLQLARARGAALGTVTSTTITISDDDGAALSQRLYLPLLLRAQASPKPR